MNLQINVRIAGTKQRRSGFAPLVSMGVLPTGEGDNMYHSTIIPENPAFVVKHAADYILYMMINRKVRPFDADASGALSIAVAISRDAQFAEGQSPYMLMMELYNRFVGSYMEQNSDGRLVFVDTDKQNDDPTFREILNKYSLVQRTNGYVVMDPAGITGIVCVSEKDMAEFFRNTQYREFAPFKEIEVGSNCYDEVSSGLGNLQIPLPTVEYEVWVNSRRTQDKLQSVNEKYYAKAESTELYAYDAVEFTLGEIMESQNNVLEKGGARITLDDVRNRVLCDLNKTDIYYELKYEWKDNVGNAKEKIDKLAEAGKVKILLGGSDITTSKTVPASLVSSSIQVKCDEDVDFKLSAFPKVDRRQHIIIATLTINNKPAPPKPLSTTRNVQQQNRIVRYDQDPRDKSYSREDKNLQSPNNDKTNKGGLDIKSLGIGVVVGLVLGLGIWGICSLIDGGEKKQAFEAKIVDDKVETPESDIDNSSLGGFVDVDTTKEGNENPEGNNAEKSGEKETSIERTDNNGKTGNKNTDKIGENQEYADREAARLDLFLKVGQNPKMGLKAYKKLVAYQKNYLTQSERIAIEALLNIEQFREKVSKVGWYKLQEIQDQTYEFYSIKDIIAVQQNKIQKVIDENPRNK